MSKVIFISILAILLTACAARIATVEYEHGVPVKAIEIHFVVAPQPSPVGAKPPAFQQLSYYYGPY